jgi:ATP-dependent Clp protease adaptor protein ClpS
MTQEQLDVTTVIKTEAEPPRMFAVVFYNDNKTYYEFVLLVLMQLYHKDYEEAGDLANQIQEQGRCAVAAYTYEVAATKRDETVALARANGHPLRVEIEPAGN